MRTYLGRTLVGSFMVLGAVGLVGLEAPVNEAEACGGFFCSQVPIDQSGEDIVFTYNTVTGGVVATIRVFFTGEASDFAWVVPVSSPPEISIAPLDLFTQLRWRTDPQFYLNWAEQEGECGPFWGLGQEANFASEPSADDGVEVVESKEVGPYETVTLQSDDAEALFKWLNKHEFDQPEGSLPLIEHYVSQNMFFVAMKLKNGATVNEIQPIELKFESSDPCVPLILTRVAAMPDMPIRIYMLGEARAVPTNWLHVIPNYKKIDWINNGSNYNDVVTQAIDEASGRAFVTEFAGKLQNADKMLYWEGKYDLEKLKGITDPAQFLQEMLNQGFPRDALVQELLRKHIPMPQELKDQGVDERNFYNNLGMYSEYLDEIDFKPEEMVKDLEERIIAPLKAAQEKIDAHPYVTRLYATVSPEEMTRDPFFDFNSDLPDVSNIHTATAEAICGEGDTIKEIIVTLEEEAETFTYVGPFENGWSIEVTDPVPTESAAKRIELLGTSGPPQVIAEWLVDKTDRDLDALTPEAVLDGLKNTVGAPKTGTQGNKINAFGCEAGSGAVPLALIAIFFLLFGLGLKRRREE